MGPNSAQALTGLGVLGVGGLMAWGASGIPSDAGYAGVGPNFLPWVVSGVLMVCGGLLTAQAIRGDQGAAPGSTRDGAAETGADAAGADATPSEAQPAAPDWRALSWMVAGVVVNASLITTAGFVLSCALCFVLAVRGLRLAEGVAAPGAAAFSQGARDLLIGMAIALPVYWIFTRLLNISLPGLTATGWI